MFLDKNEKIKTFREFLGEGFFDMIEVMKEIGNTEDVRFIYWFDN